MTVGSMVCSERGSMNSYMPLCVTFTFVNRPPGVGLAGTDADHVDDEHNGDEHVDEFADDGEAAVVADWCGAEPGNRQGDGGGVARAEQEG